MERMLYVVMVGPSAVSAHDDLATAKHVAEQKAAKEWPWTAYPDDAPGWAWNEMLPGRYFVRGTNPGTGRLCTASASVSAVPHYAGGAS